MKIEFVLPVLFASAAGSPSDDKETEWKDDVEDAETWPCRCRKFAFEVAVPSGGYVCSTARELEELVDDIVGTEDPDDKDLEEEDPEAPESPEDMRGGRGGARGGR